MRADYLLPSGPFTRPLDHFTRAEIEALAEPHIGCPVVNVPGGDVVGVVDRVTVKRDGRVSVHIDKAARDGWGPMAADQLVVPD